MADGTPRTPLNSTALPRSPGKAKKGLIVDLFAGAGGASAGIEDAYRSPDIAINHNPIAIAVHRANHPLTRHYISDVFEVDPVKATYGHPVDLLWASPDCRHHSKAKGGKPRSKKVRGLAWVIVRWAYQVRPATIVGENVKEFSAWGPLDDSSMPIKELQGRTFNAFVAVMSDGIDPEHPDLPEILQEIGEYVPKEALVRGLGYRVEFRELVAADYSTPTIRNRLYFVMRCDGRPIVWPDATAHRYATDPASAWRPAADCIDFDDLGRSIFDRPTPLADATLRRIAKGCWRHVLSSAQPFIVGVGGRMGQSPSRSVSAPAHTITAKGDSALAVPLLTEFANASVQRTFSVSTPLRTQTAQVKGGHFALAAAHLSHSLAPILIQAAHGEGKPGGVQRWGIGSRSVNHPVGTVTGSNGHAVANLRLHALPSAIDAAYVMTNTTGHAGASAHAPVPTVATGGHHALIAASLTAFGQNALGSELQEPCQTVLAGATRYALSALHLTHLTHHGDRSGYALTDPFLTVTGANRGEQAVVAANLLTIGYGERKGQQPRTHGVAAPVGTVVGTNKHALVASHIVKFRGDSIGQRVDLPLPVVTAGGAMARPAGAAHALGMASMFLDQANGGFYDGAGRSLLQPVSTVLNTGSQQRLVAAYLVKPAKDVAAITHVDADLLPADVLAKAKQCAEFLHRWLPEQFPDPAELVIVGDHVLVDITLRMLQPDELKQAQGFRRDYILDRGLFHDEMTGTYQWRRITKTDQVKLIGNSVCRQVAEALIRANCGHLIEEHGRRAA